MDYPKLTVSKQKEEYIRIQMVNMHSLKSAVVFSSDYGHFSIRSNLTKEITKLESYLIRSTMDSTDSHV